MKKYISLIFVFLLVCCVSAAAFADGSISASVVPANAGSVVGSGTFSDGIDTLVTATANAGYKFDYWSENGKVISYNASDYFTVFKDQTRNIVANFAPVTEYVQISAGVSPENAGTISNAGSFPKGYPAHITANANPGYRFVKWTEDGITVSTNASEQFKTDNNRYLIACFEAIGNRYTISASTVPATAGTVTGTGSFVEGTIATLTATPASADYVFVNWTEDGAIKSTKATEDFDVTSNRTLVANFTEKAAQFSVYAVANPTSAGTILGTGTFDTGTRQTLTAIPASSDYVFVNWTENGQELSKNPVELFDVNFGRNLVANFKLKSDEKYTVTIVPEPFSGGYPLGAGSYPLNTVVNLYANTNLGYSFAGWFDSLGNCVSSDPSYPITVSGNVQYTAKYDPVASDTYSIVYNTNGGTFSGTYPTTYSYYSVCQLPDYKNIFRSGYQFAGWYDNVNCTGYPVTYIPQFSVGNKTFYAKWIPASAVKYVTVSYSNHGTVYTGSSKVSSGAQFAVRPGESITFTFSPENLYYVYNVKVGGYNLGSRDKYTFSYESMSGNKDMYVSFGSIYGAPKTGDDSDLVLWTVLGLSALLCSGAAIFVLKKKEG